MTEGNLDSILAGLITSKQLRGVVVGLGCEGLTRIWSCGQVMTETGYHTAQADDLFLLTSVTKPITAVQILLLMDNAQLNLDDEVARYVPAFRGSVTIRHLLNHSSGINRSANLTEGPRTDLEAPDMIAAAANAPLDWLPGSRTRYCSPGFWLLAAVIGSAADMPYYDHLETAITRPLQMRGTRYHPATPPPELARHRSPRNRHLADQVRRLRYPAGGIISTVPDLLRLGVSLLPSQRGDSVDHLLSESALAMLWDFDPLLLQPSSEGRRFHLGWRVGGPGSAVSEATLWHPGASGTALWLDPRRRVVVAMLSADWYLPESLFGMVIDGALHDYDIGRAADDGRRIPRREERDETAH